VRGRRAAATLGLALVSGALALALAEIALRIVLPEPIVWRHPQERYAWDPETGHRLRPHQAAFTHDARVETNRHGLRDGELPPRPSPGTVRVLALGDSQTFGNGLPLSATWPKQLERLLQRGADDPSGFEVINAGVPGTDTWQHAIFLERLLPIYHPDAVVLGFYVNDVSERYEPPARPPPQTSAWRERTIYTLKRSSLLLVLRQAVAAIRQGWSPSRAAVLEERILSGEPDPRVEAAWAEVERSLSAMVERCRERGVAFVLLALPRRDQVAAQSPQTAYNRRLTALARQLGVPAVDPLASLRDAHRRDVQLSIPWDGHNTSAANRIVVESLAPAIRARCSAGTCTPAPQPSPGAGPEGGEKRSRSPARLRPAGAGTRGSRTPRPRGTPGSLARGRTGGARPAGRW